MERNIFDQYKQPENRVTHALGHAIASNQELLVDFVGFLLDRPCPRGCHVELQKSRVGPAEGTRDADETGDTLPDLWIYSEEKEFACVIENKITADLTGDQMEGHLKMARGFADATVVAITPNPKPPAVDDLRRENRPVAWRSWPELHSWLTRWASERQQPWLLVQFCEYLQLTQEQLYEEGKDVTITEFSGIPFSNDNPYQPMEAKGLLRDLTSYLRDSSKLREVYPGLERRSTHPIGTYIHGVWDIIKLEPNAKDFVKCPHITVAVTDSAVVLHITLPNSAPNKRYWGRLKAANWQTIFQEIVKNVSQLSASPSNKLPQSYLEIHQRHWSHNRKAGPVLDGKLSFVLDAAVQGNNRAVKVVPAWLADFKLLISRRPPANIELQIGINYSYSDYDGSSSIIKDAGFKDEAVKAAIALKPFYDFLFSTDNSPGVPATTFFETRVPNGCML